MAGVRVGKTPDAAWYVALARALKAGYAQRLTSLGDAEPQAAESCTTHITTCDADGTMVALTTTLLSSMGSRVVLPTTGVLMNNGVMWFDPRPGQPNSIGPGKRPLTNMFPVIMRDGDRPWIASGKFAFIQRNRSSYQPIGSFGFRRRELGFGIAGSQHEGTKERRTRKSLCRERPPSRSWYRRSTSRRLSPAGMAA